MLGTTLRDRISNEEIHRGYKVTHFIERICQLKWSWVQHIARMTDNRWILGKYRQTE